MFIRNGSIAISLILALSAATGALAHQQQELVEDLPRGGGGGVTSSRKTTGRVRGLKASVSISGGMGGSAGANYQKNGTKGTKKSMPRPEPVCKRSDIRRPDTGALYACVSNGGKKGDDCGEVNRFTSMPKSCDDEDEFAIVVREGVQPDNRPDETLGVLGRNNAPSTLTGATATCPPGMVAIGYSATRQSNIPDFLDIALECARVSTRTITNAAFSATVIETRDVTDTPAVPSPRANPSQGTMMEEATCPMGTILTGFEVHYTGSNTGDLETFQGVCSNASLIQTREGMRRQATTGRDVNEFSNCPLGMAIVSVEAFDTGNNRPRALRFTCTVPSFEVRRITAT